MKRGFVLIGWFAITLGMGHESHGAIEVDGERHGGSSEEEVLVRCADVQDKVEAVVTTALILRVTRAAEVVHEGQAEKRVIEAGPVYYRTGYRTGRVLAGGADLRVITDHTKNPGVAGHAHLTMRLDDELVNALLECSVY